MTKQEAYRKIRPLLEKVNEGLYWDFKKTIHENQIPDIIKDILAFSNSDYDGEAYIIVGVSEPKAQLQENKIPLSTEDRRRLNTDANYIYLPGKWNVHGLSAEDIEKMKQFSAKLTEKLSSHMLISHPQCEYIPVQINASRWLYVIVIKHTSGVFISKEDILCPYGDHKPVVKQGVLYVRIADTTTGARTDVASATEHIRVWKKYIHWLENHPVLDKCGRDDRGAKCRN